MAGDFRIVITPRAAKDLQGIHATLARSSPDGAVAVVGNLFESIDLLAVLPHRNRVHAATTGRAPVRSLPVSPYMVFFDVDDAARVVNILRVRHGARKPLKRFH